MAKGKKKESKEPEAENEFQFTKHIDGQTKGLMKEIFIDEDGTKPDLTKLERKTRNWRKIIITGVIVFLVLALCATIVGFFVFNRRNTFKEEKVGFSYTGATQAVSGDAFTLKLRYRNQGAVALTESVVDVTYPDGFTYTSSNIGTSAEYHNQWQIADLLPGDEKTLEITGTLVGEVGTSRKFSATVSYRPANFNSEFQKNIDWEVVITSTSLEVEFKGSREVIAGQEVGYELSYQNTSTRDMTNLKITPRWPEGFTLSSSNPELDLTGTWQVGTLAAGSKKTISFAGKFVGETGTQKQLDFKFGLVQSDGSENIQAEQSFLILLIAPQLQVTTSLNADTQTQAVDWGDTLSYSVGLNNAGDVKIDQGVVKLTLTYLVNGQTSSEEFIDWSTLVNSNKASRDGLVIQWNKDAVSELEALKPGDKVNVAFEVSLDHEPPAALANQKNFEIRAQVDFAGQRTGDQPEANLPLSAQGTPISAVINSQPTLSVVARYYDDAGEVIGLGPFPPVVGQSTTFKIFWSLKNTSNDITSVVVKTSLPGTVAWVGQGSVSAGEPLSFDAKTRSVTWRINKLPAYIGHETPPVTAEFSISLTPTRNQLNDYALLIDKTTFAATDVFTEASLSLSQDGESTSLTNDPVGRGKGKVIGQGN